MLGLETFLAIRLFRHSEDADTFLLEMMETCSPVLLLPSSPFRDGWIAARENWVGSFGSGRHGTARTWRVWGANYPYAWLKEIAWTDAEVSGENFHDVPWVTLVKAAMPSRTMSFKFWWWLRRNGMATRFPEGNPTERQFWTL